MPLLAASVSLLLSVASIKCGKMTVTHKQMQVMFLIVTHQLQHLKCYVEETVCTVFA